MSTTRIATVNATGRRYIVASIDFRTNVVRCWGDVVSYRDRASTHEPVFTVALADVTIDTVDRTPALLDTLFRQTLAAKREAGFIIAGGARNPKIVGRR